MARMPVKPLNPANARLRLSAAALPFRTTSDIKHRTDVVGQERALAALERSCHLVLAYVAAGS